MLLRFALLFTCDDMQMANIHVCLKLTHACSSYIITAFVQACPRLSLSPFLPA